MYKNDINALQLALKRIYRTSFGDSRGHFCKTTEHLIKMYQHSKHLGEDGIVDKELWSWIMTDALNTPCN